MLKYLSMLIVLFVCNNATAEVKDFTTTLFDSTYLVSTFNTHINESNGIEAYQPNNNTNFGMVTYKFEFEHQIISAEARMPIDRAALDFSINSGVSLQVSVDGTNFATYYQFGPPQPANPTLDISTFVAQSKVVFLRAQLFGLGARFLPENDVLSITANTIPEPTSLIYLLPFAFLSIRRLR